jgi:RNA polymerase primary sigma factor
MIQLRYGLDGEIPLTLEETGKIIGITRERVRQIQEKATFKLRNIAEFQELHRL